MATECSLSIYLLLSFQSLGIPEEYTSDFYISQILNSQIIFASEGNNYPFNTFLVFISCWLLLSMESPGCFQVQTSYLGFISLKDKFFLPKSWVFYKWYAQFHLNLILRFLLRMIQTLEQQKYYHTDNSEAP